MGSDASATVTALNNIVNASPETFIKNTDKITDLAGVTASDFASKPGYGVFVGSTDGSLQTTSKFILDGSNLDVDANINFVGNKTIGSTGVSGTLTIDPATGINFFGSTSGYNFPTTDGSNGQVLQTDGSGNLSFATATSPWTTSGNNIYYNTGNVGIGTASPSQALHVSGADKHIYIEDGNLKLDRNNEGRIEFGISGQMYGTSNGNNVYLQKSGNNHRIDFGTQGGYIKVSDTSVNNDYFQITTEGFESYSGSYFKYVQHNAANNNSGKVLEYSNASASVNRGLVQVNGDLKVNDYTTGSAVEKIKLGNDGKIYVTHGSSAISINGTAEQQGIAIGGSSKASIRSVAIGYHAGRFQGTVDTDNVLIGHYAGRLATSNSSIYVGKEAGEDSDGDKNIAIGYQAIHGTGSTASNTVAVGYQALTALTTGAGNTAVGYQAGDVITTGSNNTLIGHETGGAITTGSNNIEVGKNNRSINASNRVGVGYLTGGGNESVCIGDRAGISSTGAKLIAIGRNSANNYTGSHAIVIGYEAGSSMGSGTMNTYVGFRQGKSSSGSSYNVSIGGYAQSNGDNNVIVGYQAGQNLTTSSDGNVLLGYQAGNAETGSNKLYIENSNSTTPLIYGEFDNDIVRVNGTLQVNDPSSTGYSFPTATGTSGQVLKVNAAGDLAFTSDSNTNISNTNLALDGNRTLDQDGSNLTIDPNSGIFQVNDSSGSPTVPEIQVGQGQLDLMGLRFPNADGSANQVIKTNGSNVLSFVDQTSLANTDITLDNNRTIDADGNDFTIDPNGGEFAINDSAGQPTLAELTVSQGYVDLRGNAVRIHGLTYPSSDGTNGQVLATNGSGTLSFVTSGGGNVVDDTAPELGGDLDLGAYNITSADDIELIVDSDNNTTNSSFIVKNGAGTVLFSVNESGVTSGLLTTVTPTLSGTQSSFQQGASSTSIDISNHVTNRSYQGAIYNSSGVEQTSNPVTIDSSGNVSFTVPSTVGTNYELRIAGADTGKLRSAEVTHTFNVTASTTFTYWRIQGVNNSEVNTSSKMFLLDVEFWTGANRTGTDYPTSHLGSDTGGGITVTSGYFHSATYEDWKAFDNNSGTGHWTLGNNTANNNWLQIELTGGAQTFQSIFVRTNTSHHDAPKLKLMGSNTGNFTGEEVEVAIITGNNSSNATTTTNF